MKIFLNILLFQIAWFACVLGAGKGNLWLGPVAVSLAVAVHLAVSGDRRGELWIIGTATAIGFVLDTVMAALGIYTPARQYVPSPWSPLWLLSMWPNFATLLNVSLRWLHGRYVLSIVLGAIGGALAYFSGMQLGALSFASPLLPHLIIVGIAWGVVTPVLFRIVAAVNANQTKEHIEPARD